jgi:hypothetical protein
LATLAIGCGKKPNPLAESGGSEETSDTTEYTIKLAKRGTGTKWLFTKSSNMTIKADKAVFDDGMRNDTSEQKEQFVEQVVEPGVRWTRVYRYAQKSVGNTFQDLPYSGKIVLIEKKGDLYTFTVDGRRLTPLEAEDLMKDFNDSSR